MQNGGDSHWFVHVQLPGRSCIVTGRVVGYPSGLGAGTGAEACEACMQSMSNHLSGDAWLAALEREAGKLSGRLDGLARQVQALDGSGDPVLREAVADLGSALEELQVTQEELRLQADALAETHGSLEASRQ